MNFQLETTSFCNLTCRECPNAFMRRDRHMMTLEVWTTILRRYAVPFHRHNAHLNPPTLIVSKDGEPLLNKNLPDFLKLAALLLPNLGIDIYSHGLLLPKMPWFFDLLGSLPNKVRLMVTFHYHNHDGTTNDYTDVEAFLRERLSRPKLGPENIELVLASHLVPPMTRERLEEWAARWRPLVAGRGQVHANVLINPWTGLMEEVATTKFACCPYEKFDCMFFGATGNVIACCMDLEEEIVFGNVLKDGAREMFEAVEAFYAAQKRHEIKHDVCRNCFGLPTPGRLLQVGAKA